MFLELYRLISGLPCVGPNNSSRRAHVKRILVALRPRLGRGRNTMAARLPSHRYWRSDLYGHLGDRRRRLSFIGAATGALEAMTTSDETTTPIVGERGLALTVYILYLAGFLTGVTAFVGVIIAHMKVFSASEGLRSHFHFQIRTFWIGLGYFIVGWLLVALVVGIPILIWWFAWTLIRTIKGLLLLNEGKPIARPASWLFG